MKLAVIGPNFFSYVQAVVARLQQRGIEARFFDERHANSVAAKIYYRAGLHKALPGARERHLAGIIETIIDEGFTHVLMINAEAVGPAHAARLRARGLKLFFYSWDSLRNKPDFIHLRSELTALATFDPVDAQRLNLRYIPLFADDVFSARLHGSGAPRDIALSFCGTLHSNRSTLLRRVLRHFPAVADQVDLKIFSHSRLVFLLKTLRRIDDFAFRRIVSTTAFSRQEIADTLFRSCYVLDIPHPAQNGLTARTFEALRAGARLVTFNRHVRRLPASLQSRVVLLDEAPQAGGLDPRPAPLPPLSDAEDYFLSIDRFVDDLQEMMGLPSPGCPDHRSDTAVNG